MSAWPWAPERIVIGEFDRCKQGRCNNKADGWLLGPEGSPVPGGAICESCFIDVAGEYQDKLGEQWLLARGEPLPDQPEYRAIRFPVRNLPELRQSAHLILKPPQRAALRAARRSSPAQWCTAAMLALFLTAAQSTPAGPFDGLHVIEGVTTSRNGRWISIGVATDQYRAKVPEYKETITAELGPGHEQMFLAVECRAGPGTERFPAQPAATEIAIPDHPDQQPYNWWNPLYWILGLAGKPTERFPVTVTLADADSPRDPWHTEQAALERHRIDYSAARTLLSVRMNNSPAVLEAFTLGRETEVRVHGAQTDIRAIFPAASQLAKAAQAMMRDCPQSRRKRDE